MTNKRESSPLLFDANVPSHQELGGVCSVVEEDGPPYADDERKRLGHSSKRRSDFWERSTPAAPLLTLLLVAVAGFVSVGLISTFTSGGPSAPNEPVRNGKVRSPTPDDHSTLGHGTSFNRDQRPVAIRHIPGDRDETEPEIIVPAQKPPTRPHEQVEGERNDIASTRRDEAKAPHAPRMDVGAGARDVHAEQGRSNARVKDMKGTKPNVFFFLVDDMGWNDMGYQSTDMNEFTPNMNRLAAEGVKLSNYYSMHVCTPARAALMTGRYPVRYGMQYGVVSGGAPWGMPPQEKIMPQYFNSAGYVSHMVGKWHLGMYTEDLMPNNRGFETYLGYLHGEDDYWTHENTRAKTLDLTYFYDFGFGNATGYYDTNPIRTKSEFSVEDVVLDSYMSSDRGMTSMFDFSGMANPEGWENAQMRGNEGVLPHIERRPDVSTKLSMTSTQVDEGNMDYFGVYSEDVFLARATRIVNSKTPWDDEPLFLYLAHQAVHAPMTAVPEDAFNKEEELLLRGFNSTSETRVMFARTLFYLDKKVGQLVDTLEKNGWMENSIIVVASDNGGCPSEGSINYPLRGTKETYFEGGIKVPGFIYSKSHLPEEIWGTTYGNPMHVTDWVPTLSSAVGYKLGGSAAPLDGVDHWASITHPEIYVEPPRDEILFNWDDYTLSSAETLTRNELLTQGAFRQGKWKLITNQWCSDFVSYDPKVQNDPLLKTSNVCGTMTVCPACVTTCNGNTKYKFKDWLFDLDKDPRETTNLAEVYPETASRLRARAEEVVYADYGHSGYQSVELQAYKIWADNGCWIFPWYRFAHPAP